MPDVENSLSSERREYRGIDKPLRKLPQLEDLYEIIYYIYQLFCYSRNVLSLNRIP